MSDEQDWSQFNLGCPAYYRIKIRGYLEGNWSNRLGGMTIQHSPPGSAANITTLFGEMIDQAAMIGVLNSLYGLGFPILSVECAPKIHTVNVK
jgi:hypothetical protein